MPNWCQGVLKIRGKKRDLLNFIKNGIEEVAYQNGEIVSKSIDLKVDKFGDIYFNLDKKDIHVKETRRMFIVDDFEWSWNDNSEEDMEETYIQCLDVHQAWRIEEENLKNLSEKYNIDFKITGFECGMQFTQDIEVEDGEITLYEEKKYIDYNWEVYDPRLGG